MGRKRGYGSAYVAPVAPFSYVAFLKAGLLGAAVSGRRFPTQTASPRAKVTASVFPDGPDQWYNVSRVHPCAPLIIPISRLPEFRSAS